MLQARHWLDVRAGDLVWCTAASGWSKSARNAFVAPWLRGAAALLHDARFDPAERLEILARERVDLLCMAPTEYRTIAKRAELPGLLDLRAAVAAGEPLDPETLGAWREATNLWIRDGYGQTETGQLTGMPLGIAARAGSMGVPLPGIRLDVDDGELVADPSSIPTFFLGYLGEEPPPAGPSAVWRTGDRVERDEQGFLHFVARTDDLIISVRLPHRPGRGRVGARLARGGRGGGRGRGARRRARHDRAGGRRPARRVRALGRAGARAAGPRQGADRALQVPADRRLRRPTCRGPRAASSSARRCAQEIDKGPAGGAGPLSGGGGWRWVSPRPPRAGIAGGYEAILGG